MNGEQLKVGLICCACVVKHFIHVRTACREIHLIIATLVSIGVNVNSLSSWKLKIDEIMHAKHVICIQTSIQLSVMCIITSVDHGVKVADQ